MESGPTGVTEDDAAERATRFEAFFEAERSRLFGTLCLVTSDRGEAEELLQEAFLRVWERWGRVSELGGPVGYLDRTAFNVFRSRLRRAARAARRMFASTDADPFASVDDRHDLVGALRALTPRQRAAVVLTELMDLSSEDAAEILGIKPVTVRVLASQGRSALRRCLEATDG